jgi:antibiotic biosynthesis monooxygenase (ABM) superfamily enzyme
MVGGPGKLGKGVTVEVRVSGASSVIVHRVPPDGAGHFLEWQRGIAGSMAGFPGYLATDVDPPAEGQQELLTLFVGPLTSRLGPATGVLIGNALSVSLLQWAVMPMLPGVLGPWLRASRPRGGALTIGGTVLILGQLVGLMLVFRAVAG